MPDVSETAGSTTKDESEIRVPRCHLSGLASVRSGSFERMRRPLRPESVAPYPAVSEQSGRFQNHDPSLFAPSEAAEFPEEPKKKPNASETDRWRRRARPERIRNGPAVRSNSEWPAQDSDPGIPDEASEPAAPVSFRSRRAMPSTDRCATLVAPEGSSRRTPRQPAPRRPRRGKADRAD